MAWHPGAAGRAGGVDHAAGQGGDGEAEHQQEQQAFHKFVSMLSGAFLSQSRARQGKTKCHEV
jgi:hypothetical protein